MASRFLCEHETFLLLSSQNLNLNRTYLKHGMRYRWAIITNLCPMSSALDWFSGELCYSQLEGQARNHLKKKNSPAQKWLE